MATAGPTSNILRKQDRSAGHAGKKLAIGIVLGLAMALGISAQDDLFCTIAFNPLDGDAPLAGVSAMATNPDGQKMAATPIDGMLVFEGVPESGYTFVFRRQGYKTTELSIGTDCPDNGRRRISIDIPMTKGSPATKIPFAITPLFPEAKGAALGVMISDINDAQMRLKAQKLGTTWTYLGILNGRATSLPNPAPAARAKGVGVKDQVVVEVMFDQNGDVVQVKPVSGNAALKEFAAEAAWKAKFSKTVMAGKAMTVSGIIVYNFQ